MNWEDTTAKHFGSDANGRQAARLIVGEKSSSVRTNPGGGCRLVRAEGRHGVGADFLTIRVAGQETFETWEEAIAAGEEWVS